MWIWATGGDVRTDAEQPNNGFFVVPLVAALLWESAIFAGVSLLRLIVHYAVHPKAFPRMIMATRYVYMVVIILHLFVFFAYLGTVAAWLVLAAALEPKRFLPYGIAVVVIAVVGSMVFSQMSEAARKMKERVAESFDKVPCCRPTCPTLLLRVRCREQKLRSILTAWTACGRLALSLLRSTDDPIEDAPCAQNGAREDHRGQAADGRAAVGRRRR
jgi:hypothetical protein